MNKMVTNDPKSSVHDDEQFGNTQDNAENTELKKSQDISPDPDKKSLQDREKEENKTTDKAVSSESVSPDESGEEITNQDPRGKKMQESEASESSTDKEEEAMKGKEDNKETKKEYPEEKIVAEDKANKVSDTENQKKQTETSAKSESEKNIQNNENKSDEGEKSEATSEQKTVETVSEEEQKIEKPEDPTTENEADEKPEPETKQEQPEPEVKPEKIDYSALNRQDLVATLKDLIDNKSVLDIRNDIEIIKTSFYKKQKAESDKIRRKFLEEGGELKDFKLEENPLETELKELLKKYKDLKAEYNKTLEEEKQENLEEKYRIIEEIKDLVNRKESINKTFQEFRELQHRWRSVGLVPQQSLKDLWETYHHHVETFYDYININKELRDLDLKKNLESKIELCEKAEELLLEPSVINAFNRLQKLHDLWREIGPVPAEMRTEIWERFKETTSKINKRHQEYFINLKHEQKSNLEAKTVLCEKVEEINTQVINTHKEWEKKSNEIIELQKVWKTIGFAPKKDNNKIYQRFREACDDFFNRKREFYSQTHEEQNNNLQLKTDLCVQAESLQDSTEWQKTTEELISLQKKWKEIGPVPHKYSDKIWKRFRAACDKFFQNKAEHFSEQDSSYSQNLKMKQELIEEIEKFKGSSDVESNFEKLKEFQRRWAEIGFVPYKFKDEIQEKYRATINKQFDNLKIDDEKKNLLRFKTKIENIDQRPNSYNRLRHERDKYINKLKQLENDIVLWENNIGFFAKSKNADAMIREVKEKIDNARKNIELLKEKIQIIDEKEM